MIFSLGQRWISDTESELGLGTIVALEGRMLTVLFAASGEQRLYAIEEAPITRVRFNVGDEILSHDDSKLLVSEVVEQDNLITYIGTRVDDGSASELRETFLNNFIKFNKPQDKLFAGQIDKFDRFVLRYKSLTNQHQQQKSKLRGLLGPRVDLIPHQFYIAEEVGKRHAPRVLLADEVGLGKTIEAGLIIHQQLVTGRAKRILIVLPENLQHQWLVEMMRRFNLHFSIFDDSRCNEAYLDSINPFETEQLVLCSINLLRKRTHFENALEADWDLLIVDEAHHLIWDKEKPSRDYQVVEALSKSIPGILLLTATPEQLGHESHFARLRLLDPNRFFDYQKFIEEEEGYKPVATAINELLDNNQLSNESKNSITELLSEQDVQPLFNIVDDISLENDERQSAQHELIRNLLDRHGTGRLLFRNTRSAIQGFPKRHLKTIALPLPEQYKTAIKVSKMLPSGTVQEQAFRALYPEQIYQAFEGGESNSWCLFDPRINWLIDLIQQLKGEKILIIAAQAETALALEEALRTREAIKAAVFHEGLSLIERDKAAAYFAQTEDGAQVMICSEIGSEGRNFQFAHHLVLFDLPINPDLLEQRIGRLDRIGQRCDIQIYTPYLKGTSQEHLQNWYEQGLQAFTQTTPTGHTVFELVKEDLINLLATGENDNDQVDKLIKLTRAHNDKLKKQLEQGRDKLLEINSSGILHNSDLLDDIVEIDQKPDFTQFALQLFDVVGVQQEDRGNHCLAIRPTEHMLTSDFPGLPEEGATITFNRKTALSRDDVQYLTWEHPMVSGGMEMILSSDTGTTAVAILKNNSLPAATTFLELIYVVETINTENAQLKRFLPTTPIRLLLDKNAKDLGQNVTFDSFNRQLTPINRHISRKVANTSQPLIHQLIKDSQPTAQKLMADIIIQAKQNMQQTLEQEQDRLQALKAVNPNIREEEIQHLRDQQSNFEKILDQTQLKLDAIRFIVSTQS
ncbi:RNA polymerase-associated protein RapA [Psychromonas sp. MB-3u-54]|uniref:RNA polymerase-associated protein RapA n=1 Tax=Psychromonas sp. MB-3u-54 TaxID=2058319 RepID=UPI000C3211E5|nr:RNA polymerase-associated protein RapA [Psychromonas sp. MB-3u-54]PKH02526.1 RNA polymerase-associated protein RapA [Psychromonas sp. MB-3u-54]